MLSVLLAVVLGADASMPVQELPTDLDRAAREYRIQIYDSFRTDREEFDRRREAGRQLQADWRKAGSKSEEVAAVVDWFQQATEASLADGALPLPEHPQFSPAPAPIASQPKQSEPDLGSFTVPTPTLDEPSAAIKLLPKTDTSTVDPDTTPHPDPPVFDPPADEAAATAPTLTPVQSTTPATDEPLVTPTDESDLLIPSLDALFRDVHPTQDK